MSKKVFRWIKKPENLLVLFILLVSAFMRLYKIRDYMTFLGDEGRDVLVVYGILHGHLTLLGPTASVGGFFFGPFYYYFMAPWLWLFHYDPVGPAVGVAIFSVITTGMMYYIGKEFFNRTTGFISAGLYAIAPLVLSYSRSSWNPNLMPFFSLLTIYFVYKGIFKKNNWYLLICGICLGIAIQLHYVELFLGATVFFFILVSRFVILKEKHLDKNIFQTIKEYLIIGAGYIIGWSPFLAFEVRHGFQNTKAIYNFIFHSGDVKSGAHYFSTVSDVFFRIFGRLVTNFPSPDQIAAHMHPFATEWMWLTLLLAFLSLGYFAYAIYQKRHDQKKTLQYAIMALWFVVEVLLFGLYKKNIYDYYFESLFPLPFFIVGFFVSFLLSKQILWKSVGIIVLLALIGINLKGIPFQYAPNKQLQQTEDIARFIYNKVGAEPYNLALITGGNSDHAYRYFLTLWGRPPVTIQNSVIDPNRNTVTRQDIVICESLPCYPLGNSLWEIAGFGRAQIDGHWNVSVVKIYKLVHYTGKE